MSTVSLKNASLSGAVKYNSLLAGNPATAIPAPSPYDLLETTILTSSQGSISFNNLDTIAADYEHLQVRVTASTTRGSAADGANIRFNGDSGANYAFHRLTGDGSSLSSSANISENEIRIVNVSASTLSSGEFGGGIVDILDFNNTSKNTTIRSLNGVVGASLLRFGSGVYLNTNAITSMDFFPVDGVDSYVAGSRFSLYGIRG